MRIELQQDAENDLGVTLDTQHPFQRESHHKIPSTKRQGVIPESK
jgi:hypothetical protein